MTATAETGSIVDAFRNAVERYPDRTAVVYRDYGPTGDFTQQRRTFAEADAAAKALAATMAPTITPGDRVALLLPPGVHYPLAYLAVLYAGGVAVPLGPPEYGKTDQLGACLRDAGPSVVVTTGDYRAAVQRVLVQQQLDQVRETLTADTVDTAVGRDWAPPQRTGSDLAHLIYTSGSTGTPSGVMGTHEGVLANVAQCRRAYGFGPDTVAVSWLPFSFAMTLFLKVLGPLCSGGHSVFLSPQAFVQDPVRWLATVTDVGATFTGAPNFAYEKLLVALETADLSGIDLTTVRTLINGGERMNPHTMAKVSAALSPRGLSPTAPTPTYGITEASLSATKPLGTEYVVGEFDAEELELGRIRPPTGPVRRLVACGEPTGQHVGIVDPETGISAAAGEVGEIWLSGDSIAAGYWQRPDKTADTFVTDTGQQRLTGRRWLRTGDLGFVAAEQLYIAGRLKEVLIVNGRNIHPPDVEAVAAVVEGVRAAAVYGYESEETEEIGAVVEADTAAADHDRLRKQIVRSVALAFEVQVRRLDIVAVGAIPRTTNGKISRAACRRRYAPETGR